jgi:two-component system, OmpR family, response regulator
MTNILVVDDHESIRKLIEAYLRRAGYQVFLAADGQEALQVLDHTHIDLMVADVMMPRLDGFELTRQLRDAHYHLPVLIVTALENIDDKRQGFAAGTDDYMVKPIDFDEMLLRVAALLRRASIASAHQITIGNLTLDSDSQSVKVGANSMTLPPKEFSLLFKLLSYPNKIFTRQDLMEELWGFDNETDERTVDVHISRLRDKFDALDAFKIVTVRGLGYKAEKKV